MIKKHNYFTIFLRILFIALIFSFSNQVETEAASSPVRICNTQEWEVLKSVNQERMKAGLLPLSTFSKLQDAANIRARETTIFFSHTRTDGSSCFTVLPEVGINFYFIAGENIAAGQNDVKNVVTAWMNSPGHRANILRSSFDHMGIGYLYYPIGYYGKYWSQMFLGGCTPTSITVNNADKVSSYPKGTSVEDMNRVVIIKCSHGTSYMPLLTKMTTGYNKSTTGKKTIKVKYNGKTTTFSVNVTGTSIKEAKIFNLSSKSYTGRSLTQSPKVVLNGKTLSAGRDYTLSYANNKNAGKATVTITGKGKYSGSIKKYFTIKKRSIKEAAISKIKDHTYTGKAIRPRVTVKYNKAVVSSKNYTVTYTRNIKKGTATVIIKGKGNFTNTVTKTFRIVKKSS